MTTLAIIGGTGLIKIEGFSSRGERHVETAYGQPSAPLVSGDISGKPLIFLARHGNPHRIPPHKVNYRANIRALKDAGVENIISVNAVGGITEKMIPGAIVLPDDIIDYTCSREQTFFSEGLDQVVHIDFTSPYSEELSQKISKAATALALPHLTSGTYGATQGPRLETPAEICRMERDGCDIVGMTGMPEAALARELDMEYLSICLVVNWAAGKSDSIITMDAIDAELKTGMQKIMTLLKESIKYV